MTTDIAVCVSYCSLERPFIRSLLRQACLLSSHVVVAVGSRLYSGLPEDEAHIADLRIEFPSVALVRYPVGDDELGTPVALHNRSRTVAAAHPSASACPWVLFLDGDEVPEGTRVAAWWAHESAQARDDVAYKMANHWYFMHPCIRADTVEDSVVLIHRRHLTPAALSHSRERDGIISTASGPGATGLVRTKRLVADAGTPMFHHFSWVRSRDALLAKVSSWGHAGDRSNWSGLVLNGLQQVSSGAIPTEFVHGYGLRRVTAGSVEMPDDVCPDMALLLSS